MRAAISIFLGFTLLLACCSGRSPKPLTREAALERVKRLRLEYNQNAFVWAAAKGDLDTVSLYLDAGIDPNQEDDEDVTALAGAATNQRDEVIRLLVARGADPNRPRSWTPLTTATMEGSPGTVRALLDGGANPNAADPVGNPVAWHAIATKASDRSPVMQVRYTKPYADCLRALLEAGADVNGKSADGGTLLMRAAAVSGPETVALLIEKGANVNAIDRDGKTARQRAEEHGNADVIALLEKAGG